MPETQQEGGVATERTTASAVTEEKLLTPQMIPGATRTQRLFVLQEPATQAPFSLADWNYKVDMDKHTVTLTGYYGSDNKIKIAGRVEAGLYQDFAVAVNNLNWGINSNWITDIAFVKATDGTKVKQLEKHLQIPVLNNLTSLDLSGLDTSDVTDMSSMVRGEHALRTINLNDLDTSKVTNMS
ncbi:BspA family leucine-rich repeat surface protein [Ligilactobacillus saerimneri]|uniref:Lipoprotein n=1 Tax=Ligilactobacillus saerimneri 30a TaxID=1227363 RepID=M5J492_9LACO|nr:BspA family leucine-rich repeat surface protein [Ligilactobacillus saerimneri]EKW98938.1 lipoprotein [Ligilactobacillus saerimneri 30a]